MASSNTSDISLIFAFVGLLLGSILGFLFSILIAFWPQLSVMNPKELGWMIMQMNKLDLIILIPTGICALGGYLIGGTGIIRYLYTINRTFITFFFAVINIIMLFVADYYTGAIASHEPGMLFFMIILFAVPFLVAFFADRSSVKRIICLFIGFGLVLYITGFGLSTYDGSVSVMGVLFFALWCVSYLATYILAAIFGGTY